MNPFAFLIPFLFKKKKRKKEQNSSKRATWLFLAHVVVVGSGGGGVLVVVERASLTHSVSLSFSLHFAGASVCFLISVESWVRKRERGVGGVASSSGEVLGHIYCISSRWRRGVGLEESVFSCFTDGNKRREGSTVGGDIQCAVLYSTLLHFTLIDLFLEQLSVWWW